MAAAAEEAHQAEKLSEVVQGAVVVDVINVKAALEKRDHEYKRHDEALPQAHPEICF